MCEVWNGNRYPDVFDVKLAVSRLVEHDDRYQDRSLDMLRVKGTYLSAISAFISVGQFRAMSSGNTPRKITLNFFREYFLNY